MLVAMAEGTDKSTPKQEEGGMMLREWMPIVGALLVALVIALGIWGITWQLDKLENQRAQQAQKIENQRAAAERELAEQRAQDEALQAYLDQMSSLILEKDLRTSEEDSAVRTLARARTTMIIKRLDADGNRIVISFLNEARLTGGFQRAQGYVSPSSASRSSILSNADLSGAHLTDVNLIGANLS